MRTFGKIMLGVVALIGAGLGGVFFFTAGMAKNAEAFFEAAKVGDMDEAYAYLSDDFRANTSPAELEQYLVSNSLHRYESASWSSRSINGGVGTLEGVITTESGGAVPLTLNFAKGESGWQIYSIQKPAAGIQSESSGLQLPSREQQVRLVAESVRVFADAVNEGSMEKLHGHISGLWQQQITVEGLDTAFAAFYDLDADLRVLDQYAPQFTQEPTLTEDGMLVITGSYPTEPSRVEFEQGYIYEGLGWKLVRFNMNIE
jgi:hypothetical protein